MAKCLALPKNVVPSSVICLLAKYGGKREHFFITIVQNKPTSYTKRKMEGGFFATYLYMHNG